MPLRALLLALAMLGLGAAPAQADGLRVLTWNVWGVPWVSPDLDARIDAVAPAVAELGPDVVALQEVWEPVHGARLTAAFESAGYPHTLHFVEPGRRGGLFVASRHPLRDLGYVAFSQGGVPLVPWHVDWMADKGVARVRVDAPGGAFVLANTHLQATYGAFEYTPIRLSQALELAEALDDIEEPVVVAGDVNTRQHELPFRVLRARAGLTDAAPGFGIDALLYRGGLAVREWRRALTERRDLGGGVRRALSDHPALFVELDRAEPGAAPGSAPLDWDRVREEALGWAASSRVEWDQASWGARLGGLAFVAFVVVLLRRRRRRVGFALAACAAVLLYLGFVYGPAAHQGLKRTLTALEAAALQTPPPPPSRDPEPPAASPQTDGASPQAALTTDTDDGALRADPAPGA